MNLEELRSTYYEFSEKASDRARTLALSAIAVIWVFKDGSGTAISLDPDLLVAGLFAVGSLASDLFQYVASTIVWGRYNRQKEKAGVSPDSTFDAPAWLNWPALAFFGSKILLVAIAYVFLFAYLWTEL